MDLYLLRHGDAEPRTTAVKEAARELTSKGREDVRRVIKFVRAKLTPITILTSPYTRARQSAEIAAKALGNAEISESRNLLPSAKPATLWNELHARMDKTPVLLVGHEPHLSSLLAFLTGGAGNVEIKKGALLRITINGTREVPAGVLKWLIPPSLLR